MADNMIVNVSVDVTWLGSILIRLMAFAMRIGLVEPTIQRAERFADWLLDSKLIRVEMS